MPQPLHCTTLDGTHQWKMNRPKSSMAPYTSRPPTIMWRSRMFQARGLTMSRAGASPLHVPLSPPSSLLLPVSGRTLTMFPVVASR